MITFWNRKEIFVGFSRRDFQNALEVLKSKKIEYTYQITCYSGSSNFLIGRIGDPENSNMYYVYVHKRDVYDASKALQILKV